MAVELLLFVENNTIFRSKWVKKALLTSLAIFIVLHRVCRFSIVVVAVFFVSLGETLTSSLVLIS